MFFFVSESCQQTNRHFVYTCPCATCVWQHGLLIMSSLVKMWVSVSFSASRVALALLYLGFEQHLPDGLKWVSPSFFSLSSASFFSNPLSCKMQVLRVPPNPTFFMTIFTPAQWCSVTIKNIMYISWKYHENQGNQGNINYTLSKPAKRLNKN